MAMQNFFAKFWKSGVATQPQTSGKDLEGELRVKVEGQSVQVVKYRGMSEGKKRILWVTVKDPNTGELVFDEKYEVEK